MATASVTYSDFVAGNPAVGDQVDQNFSDLVAFLNTHVIHKDASIAFTGIPSLPSGTDPSTDHHVAKFKQSKAFGAVVRRAANQAITTATAAPVSFDTELSDQGGFWSSGDATHFIVPAGGNGFYLIGYQSNWEAATGLRTVNIQKNDTTSLAQPQFPVSDTTLDANIAVTTRFLVAGDTIRFLVTQNTGSDKNLEAGNEWANVAWIWRLGWAA